MPSTKIHKCSWSKFLIVTSKSRRKIEQNPFPRESVGGWRKDEFQWMSLALVGEWWQQHHPVTKRDTSYLSRNVLSLHTSSFTAVPSPVWEGHGGMVLNRMCVVGKVNKELTNPGSPRRKAVKTECVCVCVILAQQQPQEEESNHHFINNTSNTVNAVFHPHRQVPASTQCCFHPHRQVPASTQCCFHLHRVTLSLFAVLFCILFYFLNFTSLVTAESLTSNRILCLY